MYSKPLIYVAGPLTGSGSWFGNVNKAVETGDQLAAMGYGVFIPHLNCLWEFVKADHDYEFWLDQDMVVLERCDALYRIPGPSKGADREVKRCCDLGIPVFHDVEQAEVFLEQWNQNYKEIGV